MLAGLTKETKMAKKQEKVVPVEIAAQDARVMRFMDPANWNPAHVKPLALDKETNRGAWLRWARARDGQTLDALKADALANGLPAQAKDGAKHAYTLGMWLGWMQTAGVVTIKDA